MTEEITSEQLAEIDRDMADIERQVAELVEEAQQADYKTQELPEYTPPEGWRVLAVGEALREGDVTVRADGYQYPTERVGSVVGANQRYIRPIEPQPEPQPESDTELRAQVAFLKGREVTLGTRLQQEREVTTRLRHELKTVQNQLAAVKAELASVAANRQQLRVELDAAQQVPADSPELRQLRADLEQVTLGRDTYRDGYERVLSDLETIRETAKAETVEAIAEWLQPFRGCNSPALALLLLEALPHIMRSLTGLEDEEIE